jgi:magnesium-protoporphyrin O-methyltransferase
MSSMADCCAATLDSQFDARSAGQQLQEFRRNGPSKETKLLSSALRDAGISGATVLDIGGGIGAVQAGAFRDGAVRALSVDASNGYVDAARSLAAEHGYIDRVEYRVGDFVDIAESIPAVDVVTLDKVICCYADMNALLGRSAERADRLYAAVYPRDGLLIRAANVVHNAFRRVTRSSFRTYIHRSSAIEGVLAGHGFRMRSMATTVIWRIVVFERTETRLARRTRYERDSRRERGRPG